MPLEGLWATELGTFSWGTVEPWRSTLLIMQPEHIRQDLVEEAIAAARRTKPSAFAEEHGYQRDGRHHEISLSDPVRTKPANLRTVLRHPVVPTS